MREKKSFAERTKVLPSEEVRKKYFLVYEGKHTELLYFDAVNALKEELNINPLIELVPIVRSYGEEGWSHPKKIVDRMIRNIEESQKGNIFYETLLNWMMDYYLDQGYIANDRSLSKSIWTTLKWICQEKLGVTLGEDVIDLQKTCEEIISLLEQKTGLNNLLEDVTKIIEFGSITYAEGFDKICFVVDRDRDSFTETQYEDELRKYIPHYKKSKYNALALVKNIDTAIKNEKHFCEDIEQLVNSIGSNVGLLIYEMRE